MTLCLSCRRSGKWRISCTWRDLVSTSVSRSIDFSVSTQLRTSSVKLWIDSQLFALTGKPWCLSDPWLTDYVVVTEALLQQLPCRLVALGRWSKYTRADHRPCLAFTQLNQSVKLLWVVDIHAVHICVERVQKTVIHHRITIEFDHTSLGNSKDQSVGEN